MRIAVTLSPECLVFHSPNLQVWDGLNLQHVVVRAFMPLFPKNDTFGSRS